MIVDSCPQITQIYPAQHSRNQTDLLGVLGAFAVKVLSGINRQDAKSAKNFAKQNSFQESKDLRLSSTEQRSRNQDVSAVVSPLSPPSRSGY